MLDGHAGASGYGVDECLSGKRVRSIRDGHDQDPLYLFERDGVALVGQETDARSGRVLRRIRPLLAFPGRPLRVVLGGMLDLQVDDSPNRLVQALAGDDT